MQSNNNNVNEQTEEREDTRINIVHPDAQFIIDKYSTNKDITETRKLITLTQYRNIKKDFENYCKDRYTPDHESSEVTANKLSDYLSNLNTNGFHIQCYEYPRLVRKRRYFRYSTYESVVSAITALYYEQVEEKRKKLGLATIDTIIFSWPHPVDEKVVEFLKKLRLSAQDNPYYNRNWKIYTPDDLLKIVRQSIIPTLGYRLDLRTTLTLVSSTSLFNTDSWLESFCLKQISVLRSYPVIENKSMDLGISSNYGNKSNHPSMLIINILNTKLDRDDTDNRRLSACLRHRNVLLCTHWWMAVFLVNRFHVSKDDKISFRKIEDFFDVELISGPNQSYSFSGNTNRTSVLNPVLKEAGVDIRDIFDNATPSAIQMCRAAGVSDSNIKEFDLWSSGTQDPQKHVSHFIYRVSPAPMVVLAGGTCLGTRLDYYMNRDLVRPSEELKRKIFPFINDIIDAPYYKSVVAQYSDLPADIYYPSKLDDQEGTRIAAAVQIANLLDYLREVFLQDFKFFSEAFEDSELVDFEVKDLSLLKSSSYIEFRAHQDHVYDDIGSSRTEGSISKSMNQAPPEVVIENMGRLVQDLSHSVRKMETHTASLETEIWSLKSEVSELKKRLNLSNDELDSFGSSSTLNEAISSNLEFAANEDNDTAPPPPPPPLTSRESKFATEAQIARDCAKLKRGFSFVNFPESFAQLWQEYKTPMTDHIPSIEQLNARHGAKWRKINSDAKMYSRRKPIYDAISTGLAKGINLNRCLELLEQEKTKRNMSLTQMLKNKCIPSELLPNESLEDSSSSPKKRKKN